MRLILLLYLLLLSLQAKERIIAMSPAISEILFGLGVGEEVVGVSDYASFPKEVLTLPKIGGYFHPSLEKIIALRPTLVITNSHENKIAKQLESFGIRTVQLELTTLEGIRASIAKVAKLTNSKPDRLIEAIDSALLSAQKNPPVVPPRVLVIFGLSMDLSGGIYVAGHKIFFEDIIQACGGTNAFVQDFIGQPSLNYEGLIALNPDIVILLHNKLTDKEDVDKIKALWETVPINASKKKRVHILDGDYVSLPSHRVALTIKDICGAIHGD